ncbi:MAG: MOSC domain-containing protein [Amaricoccus sp.]
MRVRALWRHPIKGHGVEAVAETTLAAGRTMPWDRVWAIAHEAAKVAPGATAWAQCVNFGRGAKSPELMAIRAEVDEDRGRVRLTHPRRPAIEVDPDDPADAARLVGWVTPLSNPSRPAPAFVVRGDVGMTDSPFPSISILNTASLAVLGDRLGKRLAMERFRGNVWLDGLAPFGEFDLVGRGLRLGGAVLVVRERITRCVATTVDPDTGVSDVDTLAGLDAGWGHKDFGVYAEVTEGGHVAVGDSAAPL